MALERWNTHFSTTVEVEVLGCALSVCVVFGCVRVLKRSSANDGKQTRPSNPNSVPLRLAQDPASENLGTTVWDASIVLAKFFEKVCGLGGGGHASE
jgi:hypothetical protein